MSLNEHCAEFLSRDIHCGIEFLLHFVRLLDKVISMTPSFFIQAVIIIGAHDFSRDSIIILDAHT